jgi:hypothetical protein
MDKKEAIASLKTMLGSDFFTAQNKQYTIKALKLKHIDEFKEDKLFSGYFSAVEKKEILSKWINRQLEYNGTAMTYEIAMDHDWDVKDLDNAIRAIMGLSG